MAKRNHQNSSHVVVAETGNTVTVVKAAAVMAMALMVVIGNSNRSGDNGFWSVVVLVMVVTVPIQWG